MEKVKFQVYGCPAAIATTSILTEIATGKTIEEALQIGSGEIAAALGGLPDPKMHFSNLGTAALYLAIMDYKHRQEKIKKTVER